MIHKCPQCGYEPRPTPTCEPVIDHYWGVWRVLVWTEESLEHRWVKECSSKEEAEAWKEELSVLFRKRFNAGLIDLS